MCKMKNVITRKDSRHGKKWMWRAISWRTKKGVTIKSKLCLLLEVVCIFKILEFTIVWVQKVWLRNYKEYQRKKKCKGVSIDEGKRRKQNYWKEQKLKSKEKRCVEYLVVGYEVSIEIATAIIIIFGMCKRKTV
jgi:hypothetical protein